MCMCFREKKEQLSVLPLDLICIENPRCNKNKFKTRANWCGSLQLKSIAMKTLIVLSLVLIVTHSVATRAQLPDLSKKEDLKALGIGRIIEKDRSILKNITLHEVKEYWVVYIKNGSIHDLLMEKIERVEFSESKWGPIKLEFTDGKPRISAMLNQ